MNKIIALVLKLTGLGWTWEKLDGYKTKLAGIGLLCSGTAMMLTGTASVIQAVNACPGLDCVIGIIRGMTQDPNAKTVGEGFLIIQAGLATLGLGHKIEKAEAKADESVRIIPEYPHASK